MEHLVLFGVREAQEQWQRIGQPTTRELVYLFPDGPQTFSEDRALTDPALKAVVGELREKGGIAILLQPRLHGSEVSVLVRSRKAPRKALILSLDGRYRLTELDENLRIELSAWECIVVPASADEEKKLLPFVESLYGLPADYRTAMIFNLIVPTLESRLARLEQIEPLLRTLPATGVPVRGGRKWRMRDALLFAMIAPLLFGLGVLYVRVTSVENLLERQRQTLAAVGKKLGVPSEPPVDRTPPPGQERDETPDGGRPASAPAAAAERSFEDNVSRFFTTKDSSSDMILMDALRFQVGKLLDSENGPAQIGLVANMLRKHPDVRVEVFGHSDSRGSSDSKQKTSQDRADSVRNELIAAGVDAGRVTAEGRSDSSPLRNESPESAKNRRVELRFIR